MPLLLLAFVFVCVFDPADQMLGSKVILFATLWGVTLLKMNRDDLPLRSGLVAYVSAFVAIPLLSILVYYLRDGQQPFEGFGMLKGYLLVSLAVVLNLNKIDLMPMLSAALSALAVAIIAVFAAIMIEPGLYDFLKPLGVDSGLVFLDWRDYGDVTLLQAYFVTSPMLAISAPYYFDRAMASRGRRRLWLLVLAAMSLLGMILAGTRANLVGAALLPVLIIPQYTRHPLRYTARGLAALVVLSIPILSHFQSLIDPEETGNSVKLSYLADYARMFSDPWSLLFGRGLGSYEEWTALPYRYFVSELTYFEIFRNFGIIGGLIMLGMLLFPVVEPFARDAGVKRRSLAIAFSVYLFMSFWNPILFSSMGILILATLLGYQPPQRQRYTSCAVQVRDRIDAVPPVTALTCGSNQTAVPIVRPVAMPLSVKGDENAPAPDRGAA